MGCEQDSSFRINQLMSVGLKVPNLNKDSLALIYTPGVGDVCKFIQANPPAINTHTNRLNMVAVIGTGKSQKMKPISILPYLQWICLQLKHFANLDAFPLVIDPVANLDVIVKDLGNSMAGILSIDEECPKDNGDTVFVSQCKISKALGQSLFKAETVSIVMKERLHGKKWGIISEQEVKEKVGKKLTLKERGTEMFINQSKIPSRIYSDYSNKENAIFVHQYYRGKIYSHLNFSNWKVLQDNFTQKDLIAMAQTIEKEPHKAYQLTSKATQCAIITDGTAILGLGNIGPRAGLPVMEGKSCLFKALGGVNVVPICIQPRKTHEQEIIAIKHLILGLSSINLQDIAAPQCFEIQQTLSDTVDIPVFHDDQHGTAIVCLAGLINALTLAEKTASDCKLVINGAGAAGLTITKIMLNYGFKNVVVCDTKGILDKKRDYSDNKYKRMISEVTNPEEISGTLGDAIKDADVFVGVSGPNALKHQWVPLMKPKAIVFALANPTPQILPPDALKNGAFIAASGRSDFPNQINNSLVFPGIFKGLLESGMRKVTDKVKEMTAIAIAKSVGKEKLSTVHIIPDSLDVNIPVIVSRELCLLKGKE